MSISLMSDVWRMDLPTTDKMVLLALADAANDAGVTWLAVCSKRDDKLDLLKKTSLSERAVQMAIQRLCEAGHLRREERAGRGVIYNVTPPQYMHPRTTCAPAPDAPTPARRAPKPSYNHSSEAKASSESSKPTEFDDFWKAYPHKKAKGAARKAYAKARKAVDHGTLVRSVIAQVGWGVWSDPAYSPHAATWLNDERWTDEPSPERSGPSPANGKHAATNGRGPADMAEIARRRREERSQVQLPGDGWLSTGVDGVHVLGPDTGSPSDGERTHPFRDDAPFG